MITVTLVMSGKKKEEKKKILCRQIEQTISPRNTDISVRLEKQKFKCNRELRRLHCQRARAAFEGKINLGILQFDPKAGIRYHSRRRIRLRDRHLGPSFSFWLISRTFRLQYPTVVSYNIP